MSKRTLVLTQIDGKKWGQRRAGGGGMIYTIMVYLKMGRGVRVGYSNAGHKSRGEWYSKILTSNKIV